MTSDGSADRRSGASWVPVAAAITVAIVVVGVVLLLARGGSDTKSAGQRTTRTGALVCPQAYRTSKAGERPWVPAKPAGITSSTHLVPDLRPEHVVVCAYLGGLNGTSGASVAINGHRELTGNLNPAIDTLFAVTKGTVGACPAYLAKTDGDDYLIGVTFAGETVWVSAPGNHCLGSSNGSFDSAVNLRRYAAAAYRAGTWVTHPSGN